MPVVEETASEYRARVGDDEDDDGLRTPTDRDRIQAVVERARVREEENDCAAGCDEHETCRE